MPVYEYRCQSCKNDFELLELAGRDVKRACPACGSRDILQKFSVFSARESSGPSPSGDGNGGAAGECGRCGGVPGSCSIGGM